MSLLSVNFMGLPLKNPIIAAAGPWCRDAAAMQKAIDAGAIKVVETDGAKVMTLNVLVEADAIQAEGFADAAAAFDAFDKQA